MNLKIAALDEYIINNNLSVDFSRLIPPLNVIIADDDKIIRDDTEKTLKKYVKPEYQKSLSIKMAENGDEVIDLLLEHRDIGLLLLDIKMTGLSGIDVLKILANDPALVHYKNLPIVIITGETADVIKKIEELDPDNEIKILHKPIDRPLLGYITNLQFKAQVLKHQNKLAENLLVMITKDRELARKENISFFASANTYAHQERLKLLVPALLSSGVLGLSEYAQIFGAEAVLVHDKGKFSMPRTIIEKPTELDPEEIVISRMHPLVSILTEYTDETKLFSAQKFGELTHHEKFGGEDGYPSSRPTCIEQIIYTKEHGQQHTVPLHIIQQAINLADDYDATGTIRSYKDAWPLSKFTGEILKKLFSRYSPLVVEAFFDKIETLQKIVSNNQTDREQAPAVKNFYEMALNLLNTSSLKEKILAYQHRDIHPEAGQLTNKKIQIFEFFRKNIFFNYYYNLVINPQNIANNSFDQLFKNKFTELIRENPYRVSSYTLYYSYLEIGWLHRLLSFSEIQEVKEIIFTELNKLNALPDRLLKIDHIYEAKQLLALLGTLYYYAAQDNNRDDHQELLSEWKTISQKDQALNELLELLLEHKIEHIKTAMDYFATSITALFNKNLPDPKEQLIAIINDTEKIFDDLIK